jgi:lipoprotein NlpD
LAAAVLAATAAATAAAALLLLLAALLSAGCSPWSPKENTSAYKSSYRLTPDGYYRVRKGDTLHAIAFNFNMDWRDIAAWNNIRSPYTIYPDQELRLTAPGRSSSASTTRSTGSGTSSSPPASTSGTAARSSGVTVKAAPPPSSRSQAPARYDPNQWIWPTNGRLISTFKANDPTRNGIEIGGKEGQAIKATAGGEVVYSGSGLIGYGELIIIKHSERMLSAYAHNRKRLVQEGQKISAGDRIAEMGRNDRNQALLHFEIRLNGTPQDPLKYLPRR